MQDSMIEQPKSGFTATRLSVGSHRGRYKLVSRPVGAVELPLNLSVGSRHERIMYFRYEHQFQQLSANQKPAGVTRVGRSMVHRHCVTATVDGQSPTVADRLEFTATRCDATRPKWAQCSHSVGSRRKAVYSDLIVPDSSQVGRDGSL
jgi:hypothetical protein